MYYTMDEYHSLMMEAQIEMYLWDEERRTASRKRKESTAVRAAKMEARRTLTESADYE